MPPVSLTNEEAVEAAGISRRQLGYWSSRGLISPQPRREKSGVPVLWTPEEVVVVMWMGRLVRAGVEPVAAVRIARYLAKGDHLVRLTAREDGPPLYVCDLTEHR